MLEPVSMLSGESINRELVYVLPAGLILIMLVKKYRKSEMAIIRKRIYIEVGA